jgi:murein L,D-transpeptidase YcbB/YkuD
LGFCSSADRTANLFVRQSLMALRGPHIFFAAILACFAVNPALAQAPAETGAPTEAEPDSAAPPVVVLDELQTEIRDRLAEAGKKDSYLTKHDSAALAAFYEARNYAPVWVPDGLMTDRARALIERIAAADTDGLEPAAYELPSVLLELDLAGRIGRHPGGRVSLVAR